MNVKKLRITFFSKGRIPYNLKFRIDNNEVEILKDYKYFGIYFLQEVDPF
jgi:hypothetical protein